MKREKFLEKISQDERVEKIEYEKGWGYSLHLKNGFGEIIKSSSTMHFGHNYKDFTCLKIFNWLRASSQAEIEISRINARKNNLEELKIKIDEKIKEINNELSNKN